MATFDKLIKDKMITDQEDETPNAGAGLAMGFMALGDAMSQASGVSTNYLGSYLKERAAQKKAKIDSGLTPYQLTTLLEKRISGAKKSKFDKHKFEENRKQKTLDRYSRARSSAQGEVRKYKEQGNPVPSDVLQQARGIFINDKGQYFKPLEGGKIIDVKKVAKKTALNQKKVGKKEKRLIKEEPKTLKIKAKEPKVKPLPVFKGSPGHNLLSQKFYEATGEIQDYSLQNNEGKKVQQLIIKGADDTKKRAEKQFTEKATSAINEYLTVRDKVNKGLYRSIFSQLGGIPSDFSFNKNIITDDENIYYTYTLPNGKIYKKEIELPGMWGNMAGLFSKVTPDFAMEGAEALEGDPGLNEFKTGYQALTVKMLNKIAGAAVSEGEYDRFQSQKEGVGKNPIRAIIFLKDLENQVLKDATSRYDKAQQIVSGAGGHQGYSEYLKNKLSPEVMFQGYGFKNPKFYENVLFSVKSMKDDRNKKLKEEKKNIKSFYNWGGKKIYNSPSNEEGFDLTFFDKVRSDKAWQDNKKQIFDEIMFNKWGL
jgi:hypothetical protein